MPRPVYSLRFLILTLLSAIVLFYIDLSALRKIFESLSGTFRSASTRLDLHHNMSTSSTTNGWKQALDALPSTPDKIPAFFFAHGSPMLALPPSQASAMGGMAAYHGPTGPLAKFLADFGPTLLEKYKPKGIVVFSAHWETMTERVGRFQYSSNK